MNLVGNAVKFTQEGRVELTIDDCLLNIDPCEEPAGRNQSSIVNLQLSIKDTGVGVEPDELERIFEPFHQAESHERQFGGTGLGLAITRRLVGMMGGAITVDSILREGTTFRVVLPNVEVVPEDVPDEDEPQHAEPPESLRFESASVLIAEDNASNREMLRVYLSTCPFQIVEAANGREAVELVEHTCPDIILMDIHMPVLNGHKAALAIRAVKEYRHIPLVALTAYAMETQRREFEDAFDAYVSKPISRQDLLNVLARFLPHTVLSEEQAAAQVQATAQPDIAWAAEIARLAPFSEALRTDVRDTLLPRYHEVTAVLSIDDMYEFADAVAVVGETRGLPLFTSYAQELRSAGQMFDVDRMKALLKNFQDMFTVLHESE